MGVVDIGVADSLISGNLMLVIVGHIVRAAHSGVLIQNVRGVASRDAGVHDAVRATAIACLVQVIGHSPPAGQVRWTPSTVPHASVGWWLVARGRIRYYSPVKTSPRRIARIGRIGIRRRRIV